MIETTLIDGVNHTFHPKPPEYTQQEWAHMVKCFHTSKGHVIVDTLFACTFKDLGPYPLKNVVDKEGMEVRWWPSS